MRGRAWGIATVALGMCLCSTTTASANEIAESCEVGATPPGYPYEEIEPTSEIVYIGCGAALGAPVGIYAYKDALSGLCILVAFKDGSGGTCPYGPLESGRAVRMAHAGAPYHPQPGWSTAEGVLRPDVASVSVRFRRKGRARVVPAVVAQITPELAERLNQPTPFGFFAAFARGCSSGSHIRAKALSAAGEVLGRDSGRRTPCWGEQELDDEPTPRG